MALGELLRTARQALRFDQETLAARTLVSKRTVSRWENGALWPTDDKAELLVGALLEAPTEVITSLAQLLGIELEADEQASPAEAPLVVTPPIEAAAPPIAPAVPVAALVPTELPVSPPPEPEPAPPASAQRHVPSETELRGALDAIVLSASEEHNVLPRKLRAFGVELLKRVAELEIPAVDAVSLVALSRVQAKSLR